MAHTQQHTVRVACHVRASLRSNEVWEPRAGSRNSPQWHVDSSELKSQGSSRCGESPLAHSHAAQKQEISPHDWTGRQLFPSSRPWMEGACANGAHVVTDAFAVHRPGRPSPRPLASRHADPPGGSFAVGTGPLHPVLPKCIVSPTKTYNKVPGLVMSLSLILV